MARRGPDGQSVETEAGWGLAVASLDLQDGSEFESPVHVTAGGLTARRDYFGSETLYYSSTQDGLVISNSLGAMLRWPGVSDELDEEAIADFCLFNMVYRLDKSATPFKEIKAVPPGCELLFREGKASIKRWRELPYKLPELSRLGENELLEAFRSVLSECVKERAGANPSIAMSGGSDSTSVAALAAQSGSSLKAFTLHFDSVHPDEEDIFAKIAAGHIGADHEIIGCDDHPVMAPQFWDPNLMRASVFTPAWTMAEKMADHGPVGLNAYSADSILRCNPPSPWQALARLGQVRRVQEWTRRRVPLGIKSRLTKPSSLYDPPRWLNEDFSRRIDANERFAAAWGPPTEPEWPERKALEDALLDHDWSPRFADYLPYETRDPFLDERILQFVISIQGFPILSNKYILRKSMAGLVPEEVLRRKKTPLGSALPSMLKAASPDLVNNWTPDPELERFIDRDAIDDITQDLPAADSFTAYKAAMLNAWLIGLRKAKAEGFLGNPWV
jgi:asparagine synthase (glutamine-hydrolysing)